MTKEIRIYIEGGGNTGDSKAAIRRGFAGFLKALRKRAQSKKVKWQIIACGGRDAALDAFRTALKMHSNAFNILLVDAEGPVNQTVKAHLTTQGWTLPDVGDEHFHLMVQTVEAWLLTKLAHATGKTQKGRYNKIKHCADLLEQIRPEVVRSKACHCDRLFQEIEARL